MAHLHLTGGGERIINLFEIIYFIQPLLEQGMIVGIVVNLTYLYFVCSPSTLRSEQLRKLLLAAGTSAAALSFN
jgi:hypothetical protein